MKFAATRGAPVTERILSPRRRHIDDNGCWNWTGALNTNGYGILTIDRVTKPVYRQAYQHLVGPIPDGLEVDHLCRNRRCFNPEHLELVDHRTNVLRGDTIPAKWAARTECHICGGHLEPTTRPGRTGRFCRTCKNRMQREYQARKTCR